MLDKETKNKINDLRQILVGKVTDPRSQVEQITNALLYKFMNDMDEDSISMGGVPSYFVNKYKKFELGIANTDAYEKFTKTTNLKFRNKYIVLDLNFSEKFIQSVVSQNFKKNHITICGTSLFKIHKVKKIIKKINCLILNKEELYSLSKIRNIIRKANENRAVSKNKLDQQFGKYIEENNKS